MKEWDIDSPECRNLRFQNIRNLKKSSASEKPAAAPKKCGTSQSVKTNGIGHTSQQAKQHPIQKSLSQSGQKNVCLTATTSHSVPSDRTHSQKKDLSSDKVNGKCSDGEAHNNSYQGFDFNEIDSSLINDDYSRNAIQEDDSRYSLYYSPSERSDDENPAEPYANGNSYLHESSSEIECSNKKLDVAKSVNSFGYQRTRKIMKTNLGKQEISVNISPEVKVPDTDNHSSKTNFVSQKQFSAEHATSTKRASSNDNHKTKKQSKNRHLVRCNRIVSDSESDSSEVMMPNSKKIKGTQKVTSNGSKRSRKTNLKNRKRVRQNVIESDSESDASTGLLPSSHHSFSNMYVSEEDNSTCDLNTNVFKVQINDKDVASNLSTKKISPCLSKKKIKNRSVFSEASVSNYNSTLNKDDSNEVDRISPIGLCSGISPNNDSEKGFWLILRSFTKFSSHEMNQSGQSDFLKSFPNKKEHSYSSQSQNSDKNISSHSFCTETKRSSDTIPENYITSSSLSSILTPKSSTLIHESSKMLHACSKVKMVSVPLVVCDCSEDDSGNSFLSVLTSQNNKLSSTILMLGKQDPKILQSISADHLKRYHASVERLGGLSEMEIACELHSLKPPDDESEDDKTQSDLFKRVMDKALNSPSECICDTLHALIFELDALDLVFKVRQFCTSSTVVQFMESFFAGFENFPLSSLNGMNIQFRFPENFENQSMYEVVKQHVGFFAHKIWPKEAGTIKSQFVIEFAKQNLSNIEIFIVNSFFKTSDVLSLPTFISLWTYVAVSSIYKFYVRIMDE